MPSTDPDETFDHLHHLIKKGDQVKVRAWIAAGGDANLRNRYGWSLLMLAALHGQTDIVGVFLAAGTNALFQNNVGETAVSIARVKGFDRTAEAIERAIEGV